MKTMRGPETERQQKNMQSPNSEIWVTPWLFIWSLRQITYHSLWFLFSKEIFPMIVTLDDVSSCLYKYAENLKAGFAAFTRLLTMHTLPPDIQMKSLN